MTSAEKLSAILARIPGVGEKTANRYAAFIARQPPAWIQDLSETITAVGKSRPCDRCCTPTDGELCSVCRDYNRVNSRVICVVSSETDIPAIERVGGFDHTYHVLGGYLSPLEGIGPEDLNVAELVERTKTEEPTEVILALAPGVDGDTTAMYLSGFLDGKVDKITRIARGLPVGSAIEHTDQATLQVAFQRRGVE